MEFCICKMVSMVDCAWRSVICFAIEFGWWLDEVGRQPWILRGFMRTADAATTNGQVDLMLILFAIIVSCTRNWKCDCAIPNVP